MKTPTILKYKYLTICTIKIKEKIFNITLVNWILISSKCTGNDHFKGIKLYINPPIEKILNKACDAKIKQRSFQIEKLSLNEIILFYRWIFYMHVSDFSHLTWFLQRLVRLKCTLNTMLCRQVQWQQWKRNDESWSVNQTRRIQEECRLLYYKPNFILLSGVEFKFQTVCDICLIKAFIGNTGVLRTSIWR